MTTSILLRPPPLAPATPSPTPSPSLVFTPLPALQADLSSSASSSTSSSYLGLEHRPSSARSTRRIRFAPLPEPDRDSLDLYDPSLDAPQPDIKSAAQPALQDDLHDGFTALSPTISPDSTGSSVRSTPTIRPSSNTSPKITQKSTSKLLRPFSFLRRVGLSNSSKSPLSQSTSLPNSRNASFSSLPFSSSSMPNTPLFQSAKLPRPPTDDILSFGGKSLFRSRSTSSSGSSLRPSSPPPKRSDSFKPRLRSASTSTDPAVKSVDGRRDWEQGSSRSHDSATAAGSGPRTRRASTSATTPGSGGGRHTASIKMLPGASSPRSSTTSNSSLAAPKKHVRMLNGRIYGAKRYATQTLANPFANVREDPEFVEWGYGGMGSVRASADIGSDVWKGLQRSERGGALLAGSVVSPSVSGNPVGGGRGSGTPATSSTGRRKMSADIPECGMGNVGAGGVDEDDGSGMAWLKRRRAERARLEQAKEQERKTQERRKSGDSFDASMYASTASTSTSLTACTSTASTDLTTPTTSPIASRSPSVTDLKLTSSPTSESRDLDPAPPCAVTGAQSSKAVTADPPPVPKDGHEHHVLTAVRLSPNMSGLSRKLEQTHLKAVDAETTRSASSSDDDEPSRSSDEEEEQDDVENEVQFVERKTALGAGVEKISRHMGAEAR